MNYRRDFEKCFEWIESHLKESITVDEIARAMGYSLYHFYRIFYLYQSLTPMEYVVEMFEKQSVLLCMNINELVGYLGYNDKWETKDNLFCRFPLWGYGAVEKDRTKNYINVISEHGKTLVKI